jgi:hypothetical protein
VAAAGAAGGAQQGRIFSHGVSSKQLRYQHFLTFGIVVLHPAMSGIFKLAGVSTCISCMWPLAGTPHSAGGEL